MTERPLGEVPLIKISNSNGVEFVSAGVNLPLEKIDAVNESILLFVLITYASCARAERGSACKD